MGISLGLVGLGSLYYIITRRTAARRHACSIRLQMVIFNRRLSTEEIQSILDVGVMSVKPGGKLASTWSDIKR